MERRELRHYIAEFIGTAFLLAAIVGSGIMADRLTDDDGLALLQNALATGAALFAIILTLGPVSGAHINPVVTIADRMFGGLSNRETAGYLVSQVSGGVAGVVVANLMFDVSVAEWSETSRTGGDLFLAEIVATLGLLLVIFGIVRSGRTSLVAFAVAAYVASAFYFTSSTAFANPAVTVGRMFSDTFAGIEPASVPAFLAAQVIGTGLAVLLIRLLYPRIEEVADQVVVPHDDGE